MGGRGETPYLKFGSCNKDILCLARNACETQIFLCSPWMNPRRKTIWHQVFSSIRPLPLCTERPSAYKGEQEAIEGLNIVRPALSRFPDNAILIQFFAYLNSVLLFIETYKRQSQNTITRISANDVTAAEIQEAGEDLGTLLRQVLETKIEVVGIITRLENLL